MPRTTDKGRSKTMTRLDGTDTPYSELSDNELDAVNGARAGACLNSQDD
jgi:hypothetical protein